MGTPDPYARLAGVYDELVVDPCHSSWADYLVTSWSDDEVHSVVDLCCGSGLMTRELADRGYDVVGLDASAAMLARARDRLGPDAPLHRAVLPDLSCLPADRRFDAVVSTLDGLNYLTLPDLRQTLVGLADHLRPGGWLVFDVHAEGAVALLEQHPVITGTFGEATYTLLSDVDPATRRCSSTLDYRDPRPDSSFVEEHVQYLHTAQQIGDALTAAGFLILDVADEYSDAPATTDSVRATWTARRPG